MTVSPFLKRRQVVMSVLLAMSLLISTIILCSLHHQASSTKEKIIETSSLALLTDKAAEISSSNSHIISTQQHRHLQDSGSYYELHFYNQRRFLGADDQPGPLTGYARGGPVIAVLVSALQKDIDELINALSTLRFLQGDNADFPAPVLVFNEGDLSPEQRGSLIQATERPIAFPLVNFGEFPAGFDPESEAQFLVKNRSKWGYYQMIRFWVSRIWIHPAIDQFDTVMRIDSDSCFMEANPLLPNLLSDDIVYHSQYVGYEPAKETVQGLFDFCVEWMKSVDKSPGNPMMWNFIKTTWEETGTLPVLRTNFEVARKSFMQKRDVYRWLELITEQEPFPIFRYRWGDAVLRFLMIAIFAENHMVMLSRPAGYGHKELCEAENYLARYGKIG